MPSFDPAAIRAEFPILSLKVGDKPLAYLDNGATSQKPRQVLEALDRFYREENANIHRGVHYLSRKATEEYDSSRALLKEMMSVGEGHELIFVRGTTEATNLVAHGLAPELSEGDEIVLTIMEHHANIVPWQVLAEERGLKLHFVGIRADGSLDLDEWKNCFGERTKIAAFTHVSNVLGTVNPVAEMTSFARERGAITFVDGAQALPHGLFDFGATGADFYAFSGHKVFGPDGIGVLIGNREKLDSFRPYQTGGDMIERVSVSGTTFRKSPERFEAGTPNISGAIGLAEAFRFAAEIDWDAARRHERALADRLAAGLEELGDVRIFGTNPDKASLVTFFCGFAHPHDVGTVLDSSGVAVRDGHHCAQPLMDHLGVPATVRASFALYNDESDVDAFLAGMEKVKRFFG